MPTISAPVFTMQPRSDTWWHWQPTKTLQAPKKVFGFISLAFLVLSCVPKEQVVFKSVNNLTLDVGLSGNPVLKGDAFFFNPNKIKATLKEIKVEVLVDGKKAALVDQQMELLVPRNSDFSGKFWLNRLWLEKNRVFGSLKNKIATFLFSLPKFAAKIHNFYQLLS